MTEMLKDGSRIQDTKPAMVPEDLIGQFLYKSGDGEGQYPHRLHSTDTKSNGKTDVLPAEADILHNTVSTEDTFTAESAGD